MIIIPTTTTTTPTPSTSHGHGQFYLFQCISSLFVVWYNDVVCYKYLCKNILPCVHFYEFQLPSLNGTSRVWTIQYPISWRFPRVLFIVKCEYNNSRLIMPLTFLETFKYSTNILHNSKEMSRSFSFHIFTIKTVLNFQQVSYRISFLLEVYRWLHILVLFITTWQLILEFNYDVFSSPT